MSTQPELLACPFCGSHAKMSTSGGAFRIYCSNENGCTASTGYWQNEENVVRRWNDRCAVAQRASYQAEGVTTPCEPVPDAGLLYGMAAAQCAPHPSGEPAGYLHQMWEIRGEPPHVMYSSSKNNPWSHWLADYRVRCKYECTSLYDHSAVSSAARETLADAFVAGADAVHAEWVAAHDRGEGPPRGDPSFGEAAHDYALSLPAAGGEASKREAEWHDIETAPKDGRKILVWPYWSDGLPCEVYWRDMKRIVGRWEITPSFFCHNATPTHWRPVPTPPASLRKDG